MLHEAVRPTVKQASRCTKNIHLTVTAIYIIVDDNVRVHLFYPSVYINAVMVSVRSSHFSRHSPRPNENQ